MRGDAISEAGDDGGTRLTIDGGRDVGDGGRE